MTIYKPASKFGNIKSVKMDFPDYETSRRFVGIKKVLRFNRRKELIGTKIKIYVTEPMKRHKK